ncbi:MAG: carboxypeptidase-like regulatory domain-containing protein, partial [Candidatus Paceibacterota bacterium]
IRQGTYPADIYIINYDNQAITHIKGQLIVSGLGIFSMGTVALPAVATGLAVGFLPSLYDLLMILFRALGYFFGRKKKDNPWGTVYDSVTKRPLDPVYLTVSQILSAGQPAKEMATAITDIDGRFSFFLPAGTYTVKANKTHYRFPSERLAGKTNDELYDHLYFGGEFATTGEAIINLNIPMDPIDFDWNEFAKTKTNFFAFYQQRRLWLNRLYKFVFAVGLIFSVYSLVVSPLWWNAMILALYAILILINRFWRGRHKPLRVISAQTGEPLPFAIIRVFLPDLNQQIKYTVADKMGRFYLLVRPGVYYYTVEEKQPDGTYLKVFQSQPISLPKGVLTTDILAG